MEDYRHYVPVLRWKRGEWLALKYLDEGVRSQITPLVEIPPSRFWPRKDEQSLDIDGRVSEIADAILESWGGSAPLLVDLGLVNTSVLRTSNGGHLLSRFSDEARKRGIRVIPVTGLIRDGGYQSAALDMAVQDGEGLCLRLGLDELGHAGLAEEIDSLMGEFGLSHADVDLAVDLGLVQQPAMALRGILSRIPNLGAWRTFTMISGAFPRDLTGFKIGTHELPRADWLTWRNEIVGSAPKQTRPPRFGDYTIQHPIFSEPPLGANVSASIRYTSDEHWIILRGEGLRKQGGTGHRQYIAHSILLRERPEYCGPGFSYGDRYIDEIATMGLKPGSPETWIRAGVNHHVTFVVRQIANLRGL